MRVKRQSHMTEGRGLAPLLNFNKTCSHTGFIFLNLVMSEAGISTDDQSLSCPRAGTPGQGHVRSFDMLITQIHISYSTSSVHLRFHLSADRSLGLSITYETRVYSI